MGFVMRQPKQPGDPFSAPGVEQTTGNNGQAFMKSPSRIISNEGQPHCLLRWQTGSLPLVPPGKPKVLFTVLLCVQFRQ